VDPKGYDGEVVECEKEKGMGEIEGIRVKEKEVSEESQIKVTILNGPLWFHRRARDRGEKGGRIGEGGKRDGGLKVLPGMDKREESKGKKRRKRG